MSAFIALMLLAGSGAECRAVRITQPAGQPRITTLCRDADGVWREAPSGTTRDLPAHARVLFQGTYDVIVARRVSMSRGPNFRDPRDSMNGTPGRRVSGTFTLHASFENSSVTMTVVSTGGENSTFHLSGTYQNGHCRLVSDRDRILYEGSCGSSGFSGRISGGERNDGANVAGTFETVGSQVVDIAEQEHQQWRKIAPGPASQFAQARSTPAAGDTMETRRLLASSVPLAIKNKAAQVGLDREWAGWGDMTQPFKPIVVGFVEPPINGGYSAGAKFVRVMYGDSRESFIDVGFVGSNPVCRRESYATRCQNLPPPAKESIAARGQAFTNGLRSAVRDGLSSPAPRGKCAASIPDELCAAQ